MSDVIDAYKEDLDKGTHYVFICGERAFINKCSSENKKVIERLRTLATEIENGIYDS